MQSSVRATSGSSVMGFGRIRAPAYAAIQGLLESRPRERHRWACHLYGDWTCGITLAWPATVGFGAGRRPVVSGALILVLIGWLYNNALRKTPYPHYW
jgi:hypothetical protein